MREKKSFFARIALWLAGLAAAACGAKAEVETIPAGALVVDVRTPGEYGERHFPGAVNIPVDEVASRLGELGPEERTIVVYCRSGNRSGRAKAILEKAGFTDVRNGGGLDAMMRLAAGAGQAAP